MEQLYQDYGAEGLLAITMMTQNADGTEATPELATRWAETHGLTHPVVAAPESTSNVRDYFSMLWFPQEKLLSPGMVVAVDGGADDIISIQPWDLAGALEGGE